MNLNRKSILAVILAVGVLLNSAFTASASEQLDESVRNLKWRSGAITLAISRSVKDAPANFRGDVEEALRSGVQAWASVANVEFALIESSLETISPRGKQGDGVSLLTVAATAENIRLFPEQSRSPSATTRVFYDRMGRISEADIVLNPFVQFSTDGTYGTYDLKTTIAHEIGHMLGLGHSGVIGALMYERAGKNQNGSVKGSGGLLTASDVAAVRALYGAHPQIIECCGIITGRLAAGSPAKFTRSIAWIEDARTGSVAAASTLDEDGTFRLEGVVEGEYKLYFQGTREGDLTVSHDIPVTVSTDEMTSVRLTSATFPFPKQEMLLGTDAQLSRLPVRVTGDQTLRLFVGSIGSDSIFSSLRTSSTFINFFSDSLRRADYGASVNAFSIDLRIDAETPPGNYTIAAEGTDGRVQYLVGALRVEER